MSRNSKSIVYICNQTLKSKTRFGESKHEAKIAGNANQYIYSYNTFETYRKWVNNMIKWARNKGYKLRTLEDVDKHSVDYLQHLINNNYSPYTIKLARSSLSKLLGVEYSHFDIDIPTRKRSEITRSRNRELALKNFSEAKNMEQVIFCKTTGCRAFEARAAVGDNLRLIKGEYYLFIPRGKGGKSRLAKLYGTEEEINLVVQLCQNVGSDLVLPNFKNAANTHGYRADYAQRVYLANCRDLSTINRHEIMYSRNDMKGRKLDKKALLVTSKMLGHNRISVVANNYLYNL